MKTTSVVVLALLCASTLARPIALLKDKHLDTRDIAPSIVTDLESHSRKVNLGGVGKGRNENGLTAKDLVNDNGELVARYFQDNFLEARDFEGDLEARDFDNDFLEAREFDDSYLYGRDFEDDLEARDFGHPAYNHLTVSNQYGQYRKRNLDLEKREFDADLEARGLYHWLNHETDKLGYLFMNKNEREAWDAQQRVVPV